MTQDDKDTLYTKLLKLQYWFDTDEEILDIMTMFERNQHDIMVGLVRDCIKIVEKE